MNIWEYRWIVEDTNCASIIELLIQDMKEAPRSLSEDVGFEKAIEFVENIYKEIKDIY